MCLGQSCRFRISSHSEKAAHTSVTQQAGGDSHHGMHQLYALCKTLMQMDSKLVTFLDIGERGRPLVRPCAKSSHSCSSALKACTPCSYTPPLSNTLHYSVIHLTKMVAQGSLVGPLASIQLCLAAYIFFSFLSFSHKGAW